MFRRCCERIARFCTRKDEREQVRDVVQKLGAPTAFCTGTAASTGILDGWRDAYDQSMYAAEYSTMPSKTLTSRGADMLGAYSGPNRAGEEAVARVETQSRGVLQGHAVLWEPVRAAEPRDVACGLRTRREVD